MDYEKRIMEYGKYSRADIALSGTQEIQAFENIVALAVRQLQASPVTQLSGCPLEAQAGIKGKDLIETKAMLEKFAANFGWDVPQLEPSEQDPEDIPQQVTALAELLRAAGADVQITKATL